MKEIGSEFWDVPVTENNNCLFPESTQWFLSGRSALQAIIKELDDCHTVSIPSWCCDSMVKPFVDAGKKVLFYPVCWMDGFFQEISVDSDVLFVMDYFGYTCQQQNLSNYKGIVIRDVTHSLFSATYDDADYYFGSLRKWCGVWTGGYAWAKDGRKLSMESSDDYGYISLRERAMQLKRSYIHEYGVEDKSYLKFYDAAEEALENVGIVQATDRDECLAKKLDVEFIKRKRRINAEILCSAFRKWLIFPELKENDCPMFVPVLVPDGRRDKLRRFLINNKIYCPVHWPMSRYHKLNEAMKSIYINELSLVCDQRYTEEDMIRMVETIRLFMEEV